MVLYNIFKGSIKVLIMIINHPLTLFIAAHLGIYICYTEYKKADYGDQILLFSCLRNFPILAAQLILHFTATILTCYLAAWSYIASPGDINVILDLLEVIDDATSFITESEILKRDKTCEAW
jgi:hypothetical protein